jgi:2-oxoglutaroyl-CoA hydrolase
MHAELELAKAASAALTPASALDGFRVEIDPARERADIVLCRPAVQRDQHAAARAAAHHLRGARRQRGRAGDRPARGRRALLQWRQHQGLPAGDARACVQAGVERGGSGALQQAGDCGGARLLLRRRLRAVAGLRLPAGHAETLYALPEQKLGQIPGSGGSARLQKMVGITRTKDIVMRSRRIPGKQAVRLGRGHRMRADAGAGSGHRCPGRRAARFSPLAQRTAKKLLNDTEDSPLSVAIELEGPLLQPAAQLGRFPGRRRSLPHKRKPNFVGT